MDASEPPGDGDEGLGRPGCCPACGLPFLPGEEQVTAWSFGLWDTALGSVRGGTVFSARCTACRAPLASQPGAAAWADAAPPSVRWWRDGHFYRIGDPDA